LSATNRKLKTPEAPRVLAWIVGLAVTSAILFFSVTYWVGPAVQIHPALLQTSSWLTISILWLVGLILARIKVAKFSPSLGQAEPVNWLDALRKRKSTTENAEPEKQDCPGQPPAEGTLDLEKVLEAQVSKALTNNQVKLILEIPEDTELKIMGQKWKVKKGKLTITTQKKPGQDITTAFENRTRRKMA